MKSYNIFIKVRYDSNFVILDANFVKRLVGILNCNHFRCVCDEKSQIFHEKLIQLKFCHMDVNFGKHLVRSMGSGIHVWIRWTHVLCPCVGHNPCLLYGNNKKSIYILIWPIVYVLIDA